MPSAPASETAAARAGIAAMGAWTIGWSMPRSAQTGVRTTVAASGVGRRKRLSCPPVPAVEVREVAGIPRFVQPGSAEIPVRADLARGGTQVLPQLREGRPAPEPVAVVDAVDDESRLEHQRVRNHRVVRRIGVLLDVEVLLHGPLGI